MSATTPEEVSAVSAAAKAAPKEVLTARLGAEEYGIDMLRGVIVPIIDLRTRLALDAAVNVSDVVQLGAVDVAAPVHALSRPPPPCPLAHMEEANPMKEMYTLAAIALAAATLAGTAAAETVRMTGASTVFNVVIAKTRAAAEKSSGHTLQVLRSNTGKGLVDLADGASDLAMVSEPLDIAIEAAAVAGKKVDPKAIQFFELAKDEIVFVVHPSNPVGKLTWDQIRDIHTGKITNWKDVGGKDQAIVVYGDSTTGGTRAMIKKIVMGGADYAPAVKAQSSVKRAAELVAGDEAGFAGVGKGFVAEAKAKAVDTRKLERPLALATLGAPKPAAKAVIEAFAREAKTL